MKKEMVEARLNEIAVYMEENDHPGAYVYRARSNDWVKGNYNRTYISVREYRVSGKKWISRKDYDFGYINNVTGEYVPGEYDLTDVEYGEWEIEETDTNPEATVKSDSVRRDAIVNALETAAVEDAKLYREKGMPEEKIEKAIAAINKVADIIASVSVETIDDVFWDIKPQDDVKEIGKHTLSVLRVFGPRSVEQEKLKEKTLAALSAAR